ncbi:hypothetical protein U9M48_014070 [Paspalum notatum var. saurae]|uniref:Uncharacterized protein n=1 Tax=Paspalum notatum var. saurae TaxID=547442 RepID=A0AAQ3WK50_PASNO
MLEDHRTLLYPDCKEGHKKLCSILELLQWKASNGVSDKGFNELLMLIKKLLQEGNKLPATTYEAKELDCPLGLEVQKIHACPNDCILYMCVKHRGIRSNVKTPVTLRGNLQGRECLLRNKEHAKIIQWHKEEPLIRGPKQPSNDIDVYLQLSVEELTMD